MKYYRMFFIGALLGINIACAKSYESRLVGDWKSCGVMTPKEGVVRSENMKPEFKKMFDVATLEANFDRDGLAKITSVGKNPFSGKVETEVQLFKWHIENERSIVLTSGDKVGYNLLLKDQYLLLEPPAGTGLFIALCSK